MSGLVRVYEDDTAIFGRVRNVALVGWREAPSVAAIRAWQRAFIQTILLVARPPTPTKVFADVRGATTWMTPRISDVTGQTWTEPELRGACDELVVALAP